MKNTRICLFALCALLFAAAFCACSKNPTEEKTTHQPQTTSVVFASSTSASDCDHAYDFKCFEWTRNGADAVYVCKKDETHTDRRPAQVSETILKEATSSLAGEKTQTASYDGHTESRTAAYMAEEVTLTVYAVNDFHGAVNEERSCAGLVNFASYFKNKGDDPNTLLIDSGDTWQGSIASNYNSGLLLCDIYNYVGFDAKTVGNHEFDWLPEIIERNAAHASYGRTTPFLAANVYDYDMPDHRVGAVQQEQLGKKSVVYTMASGLKVGIVGVIDSSCISSINTLNVMDLCFTDHVAAIKTEAAALRGGGCDVVICSIHGDEDCVLGQGLEDYVDLVLCAHSHQLEQTTENGLLFAQFKANGEYFGEITLTFNSGTGSCAASARNISAAQLSSEVKIADPEITSILARYESEYRAEADVVIANAVHGAFTSREELPNLMCRAMFDAAKKEGYDVVLSCVNKARADMPLGKWTYEDLYKAFPFDDTVVIAEITGREILNEIAKYNYFYRSPGFTEKIDPDKKYLIASADYIFFHTNEMRRFNYFPETAGVFTAMLQDNYRVILRNWLIENGYANGLYLPSENFRNDNWAHNGKMLK